MNDGESTSLSAVISLPIPTTEREKKKKKEAESGTTISPKKVTSLKMDIDEKQMTGTTGKLVNMTCSSRKDTDRCPMKKSKIKTLI